MFDINELASEGSNATLWPHSPSLIVMDAEKDPRRGIQSIEVGGSLLQALVRAATPMMLKDLARSAGMPPARPTPTW